jgi:restriction endonuclease Mrr
MINRPSNSNVLLITGVQLLVLFLGFCFLIASPVLAVLYFISVFFYWKKWRKDKKVQLKAWEEARKLASQVSLQKERERIAKMPEWKRKGYSSPTKYLADKERLTRRREQDHFLAKSYKQRQKISVFKKKLTSIDNLLKLSPIDFERWVRHHVFEKEGWVVSETRTTGDGGIDLVLNRKGERSIAQCKRFKQIVGEPPMRDFYGTMMSEGVSRGYFVTTGLFSLPALKFAGNKPIELIDRRVLAQKYL